MTDAPLSYSVLVGQGGFGRMSAKQDLRHVLLGNARVLASSKVVMPPRLAPEGLRFETIF
jgi:hypothetical protein